MSDIHDKQNAILKATLDLIAEHGFHGTSMSMVVKKSGVSTGIIYHYFDGKDDLIRALYTRIKADFGRALMIGEPHKQPFPEHIQQVWLNAYRYYVTHPKETLFLEQYENSPYQQQWDIHTLDENMHRLMQMVTDDYTQGTVRQMPFEVLSDLTLGVALNLAKRTIAGTIQPDDALLEETANACCRAIKA